METKSILYGCVSVLAITISICACVFTYNNSCRVRITCEVGNASATRYVALDDEEAISLLYAQLVHAIKNSEKVYKEKFAAQQSDYRPSKHQQKTIDRASAAREKRKIDVGGCTDVTIKEGDTHVTLELSDGVREVLNKKLESYSKEYWKNHLDSIKKGLIEI